MKIITSVIATFILSLITHAGDSLYTAKAAIEFKSNANISPEQVLTANLPRGDQSVSLRAVPNTQIFEILVSASDPKSAAKRANQIALSLQSLLNDPDGNPKVVLIWQKASASDATLQSNQR